MIACWAVLVIIGVSCAGRLSGLLSTSLAVPGTSSEKADSILTQHFGDNIEGTFTVVLRVANPSAGALKSLDRRFVAVARVLPSGRAMPLRPVAGIVYGQIATSLDLQQAALQTARLRLALGRSGLPPSYVTGPPALQHDITPILQADLKRGELIAILVALVLLGLVLGLSAALVMPLAVALCTTFASLGVVYLLAHEFLMVLYVPNLVELIGLGLAIDYSLLVVHRFKFELAEEDRVVDDAIVATPW